MTTPPPPEPITGAHLLFTLDPGIAHLNHGSFGAVPLPVQRAQQRLRDEMESDPDVFFTAGLTERLAEARAHVSAFLGADADSTAFVANATAGAGIALASLRLSPGDEILMTDHAYGAVALAVRRICARTGATHRVIPIELEAGEAEIVAAIAREITPGRTRLVIVDQITSSTAKVMPVASIVAVAHEAGVPVLVDAAHAPGTSPVPVAAIGADFWVGNMHKWAFAPRPTAVLSVAASYRDRVEPPVISWHIGDGFPLAVEMRGTMDYTPWLAAPVGVDVWRALGVDRVRAHNAALCSYGQSVVGAALGLRSASDLPDPGSSGSAMRLVPLPAGTVRDGDEADTLQARIAEELRVRVPVTVWRDRTFLRLAAQVYNRPDEYDRLAAGLPGILRG